VYLVAIILALVYLGRARGPALLTLAGVGVQIVTTVGLTVARGVLIESQQAGDLAAGDFVWVHVRAPRNATLAEIEQQAAGIVGDHGTQLFKPSRPLYLFRGTLSSVGSGTVTVHVTGGNHHALKLLIGSSSDQTFATGENTIFLLWQGKVPTVIDASKLVVGDKIVVRIRADKGASLGQVESTPANHVGDREPAAKA